MKTTSNTALAELAADLGVQASYLDACGSVSRPSDASLLAIIQALGIDIDKPRQASRARRAWRATVGRQLAPPVVVVWDGRPTQVNLQPRDGSLVQCELQLEDGSRLPIVTSRDRASLQLPADLAHGYHRLEVEQGEERVRVLVISAPSVTPQPPALERSWGVFAPVYSLARESDWGVGDLRSAGELARIVHDRGGSLVGSTPLLAGFMAELHEPSPYSPVSRLAWNELYLDLESIDELRSGMADTLVRSPPVRAERQRLQRLDLIDYPAVAALRRRVLEAGLEQLTPGSPRDLELTAWLAERPRIADYAVFRAATEQHGGPWQRWAPAARDGVLDLGVDADPDVVRYHEWTQWLMDRQLADLAATDSAGLYLDLPVGAHLSGYDSWRFREQFAVGISVGAPPDLLGPDGQNWSLPPLRPGRQRAAGHDYFIESIQHLFRHADAVRIDHVMGLHRLFWIPDAMPPSEGAYVTCPQQELWAIICLEAQRSNVLVVGEDLGTVPDETRIAMERHEVSRSYVLEFALSGDATGVEPLNLPAANMLATLDTHDSATIVAWWRQLDTKSQTSITTMLQRRELLATGASDEVAVATALLHLLAASDAHVVIATLEDLWGEQLPQNVPGTTGPDQANWRRRCKVGLEHFASNPDLNGALRRTDTLRRTSVKVADDPSQSTPSLVRAPMITQADPSFRERR